MTKTADPARPAAAETDRIEVRRRPGWLTAICVLALVLGGLGLLNALVSLVSTTTGMQIDVLIQRVTAVGPSQGASPRVLQVEEEMQQAIVAMQIKWQAVLLYLSINHLVASLLLLVGGVLALRWSPAGRHLLVAAFAAAALFELARLPPTISMQLTSIDIVKEYLPRLIEASTPPGRPLPPTARGTLTTVMPLVMVVTVAVSVAMAVLKIAFYAAGVVILRHHRIRGLFKPAAGDAA